MIDAVVRRVPVSALACHFHDTYGQALATSTRRCREVSACSNSSVAGLGGCPTRAGAFRQPGH